jgi:beta-mannosidase
LTTLSARSTAFATPTTLARVVGHDVVALDVGWEAAVALAGASDGAALEGLDELEWLPARVPGTAAGALRDAGREAGDLDSQDWWFRTTFEAYPAEAGEEVVLCLDGLATLADVFLNGELVLQGESMFAAHAIEISELLRPGNRLAIRFRALKPELGVQRRPRARWRTRLVADNSLRWFRTMLLGRIPSFSPGPAAVGPWRPVRIERRRHLVVDALRVRPRLDGDNGVVTVSARLRGLNGHLTGPVDLEVDGPSGRHRGSLGTTLDGPVLTVEGEVRIPAVERWWPHTHGTPALHTARLLVGTPEREIAVEAGRIGFRTLAPGPAGTDIDRDGLSIHVNGVPIFARGALWTPLDIVTMTASAAELRAALETVVAAGMNMLRLPGFGPYEQDAFHDLCDELGILVWQDLMFASMDYPFEDDRFRGVAEAEVQDVATRLAGRPSTAVLCGNSEVEQQVAMLGLDLGLARIPFYDTAAPELATAAGLDTVYVPSSPFGGDLPMRPDRGVTNYYGVGGYRQPLADARTSGIRFAAECLAFANIPDDEALATLVPEPPGEAFTHHPRWKAGVPRDAGAGWDFDDLRDHYLALLFGVEPATLRRDSWDRYLGLSRAVTGEVMAHVFGEWRRAASPNNGGMILWLRDLVAGAAYGVVDNRGRPKTPYHHLRRILAPTAVWLVDEGIGGVIAHVANDGPRTLSARLRVALYTDQEVQVGLAEERLELPPHGVTHRDIEAVIGHFVDAAWAYRFGPPAQDVIVASLIRDGGNGDELLSQAFHFPAGRPMAVEPERRLGLTGTAIEAADGTVSLTVASRRLAYGVRIQVAGFAPSDDAFSVEPGGTRLVTLRPVGGVPYAGGGLTALNLSGRAAIRGPQSGS